MKDIPVSKSLLLGLRVFVVLARTLSVTRAADDLNVTPGAVSQQIKQLEELMGLELFARANGRLTLNQEGAALALQMQACFSQIGQAVNSIVRVAAPNSLRLKVMPTFVVRWLLPRLASFYAEYPDTKLEIATMAGLDEATFEQADVVIVHGDGNWDGMHAQLIFADALLPVCSPQIAQRLHAPGDLLRENLLHSMVRKDAWRTWFDAQSVAFPDNDEGTLVAHASLAYQAAQQGLGVAIAQLSYVRQELRSGVLVAPFPQPVAGANGYFAVCAARRASHPAIKRFLDWLSEQAV